MDDRLSPRQREVAQLVSRGLTDMEIGRQMGVSVHTVRWHLREAQALLGARNRVHLAVTVVRSGPNED